ncbi:MAG: hypothetical protein R2828_35820 [Saprospiraceae bacterium]
MLNHQLSHCLFICPNGSLLIQRQPDGLLMVTVIQDTSCPEEAQANTN